MLGLCRRSWTQRMLREVERRLWPAFGPFEVLRQWGAYTVTYDLATERLLSLRAYLEMRAAR